MLLGDSGVRGTALNNLSVKSKSTVPGLPRNCHSWFGSTTSLCERARPRSDEHTSELQSLMRISYAVFCLIKQWHLDLQYILLSQFTRHLSVHGYFGCSL